MEQSKKTSQGYVLDANGNIQSYDCNFHTDRFTFLGLPCMFNKETDESKSFRSKFTEYMLGIIGTDSNQVNRDDLVQEYLRVGIGDIPHFVHQYLWNRYGLPGILPPEDIQKMYLESCDFLNDLADEGKIERKSIMV